MPLWTVRKQTLPLSGRLHQAADPIHPPSHADSHILCKLHKYNSTKVRSGTQPAALSSRFCLPGADPYSAQADQKYHHTNKRYLSPIPAFPSFFPNLLYFPFPGRHKSGSNTLSIISSHQNSFPQAVPPSGSYTQPDALKNNPAR